MADERSERPLDVIVCYRKCWACTFDQHDPQWHTWADTEDVECAVRIGHPDPSSQKCGCSCCRDAERPPATGADAEAGP